MLTNTEIATAARSAAWNIETFGWFRILPAGGAQRFPADPSVNKCFCILTAIEARGYIQVTDAFADYLGRPDYMHSGEFLESWNDGQESAEEVISALRSFADHIEREVELV